MEAQVEGGLSHQLLLTQDVTPQFAPELPAQLPPALPKAHDQPQHHTAEALHPGSHSQVSCVCVSTCGTVWYCGTVVTCMELVVFWEGDQGSPHSMHVFTSGDRRERQGSQQSLDSGVVYPLFPPQLLQPEEACSVCARYAIDRTSQGRFQS